jgi:phage-related holin
MKYETLGGLIGAIIVGIVASWQIVVVVFVLYALTLMGNLITGLLYANQTKSYNEEIGRQAFYRKAGVITGIIVLIFVDWIIMGIARSTGITYSIPFFASILASYSAAHEIVSMLSNIKKLGGKVPAVIDEAAKRAEEALNQGKIPDLANIIKSDNQSK